MAKKIANKKYGIVLVGRDWKMPFKDIEPVINKVKKEFPEFAGSVKLRGLCQDWTESISC